jgi:hypothetical protein
MKLVLLTLWSLHKTNRLLTCTLTSGSRDLGGPRDAHAHPTIERLSSNHDQHTTNPTWPTSVVPPCDWMSAAAVSPAEPFLTGRAGEATIHARPGNPYEMSTQRSGTSAAAWPGVATRECIGLNGPVHLCHGTWSCQLL